MRPKGKLLALVAMFAAVGLITATGAFTTVEAERTAEVDVAGDSAALLAIDGGSSGVGDVVENEGNAATIDLTNLDTGQGADGINAVANTTITDIVQLTNQGTENGIAITAEVTNVDGDDIDVYIVDSDGDVADGDQLETLDPGDSVEFGLKFDLLTNEVDSVDNFDVTIEINADQVEQA